MRVTLFRSNAKRLLGVSLAEALVAIGVFAVLLTGLTRNVRPPSSLESELAADVLAEELRSLRAKAMRERMPVALVIPKTPQDYATGYYALEGYGPPRVCRTGPLGNDFKSVYIVAGTWASSSSFGAPATDPEFDLSAWDPPTPDDHIIAFTPKGRVVSNLPSMLDFTTLVLSTQVSLSEETIAGRSYPRVEAARKVVSVRVNRSGLVQVVPGLPDAAALPSLDSGTLPIQTVLPAPTGFSEDASPVLESLEFFPERSPNLPPEIEASVLVGQYLRLLVRAEDDDGGPLSIEWWAERPSGEPGLGSFSFSGKTQMEWVDGSWQSVWEWTPPENVDPVLPEEFILKCRIEDAEGHQVETQIGSSAGKIWAMRDGIVLYDTIKNGQRVVMAINADGTEERQIYEGAALPAASPWGDCIAMVGFGQGIYVATRDGSEVTQVFKPAPPQRALVSRLAWNPDGSQICFTLRDYDANPAATVQEDIYIVNADGSGVQQIAGPYSTTSNNASTIAWGFVGTTYDRSDPNGQFILYTPSHAPTGDNKTRRLSLVDGSELPIGVAFSPGGSSIGSASLSIDRQRMVAVEMPSYKIVNYTMQSDGTFGAAVSTGVSGIQPVYSYSADKIAFTHVVGGQLAIGVMDAAGNNVTDLSAQAADSQGPTWLLGGGILE